MVANDSEKKLLQDNLMQAVKNCSKLMIGNRQLTSSFKITLCNFLDFIEDKYKDGVHSYRMDSSIKITKDNGENFEESCNIHFDAEIKGTDVEIKNGLVTAERDFIPLNWNL